MERIDFERLAGRLASERAFRNRVSAPALERILGRVAEVCDNVTPTEPPLQMAEPGARRYEVK